ncbi:MAG: alpha-galactosidase [Lachnospiraceae bacterium]|nr:alpha-galactosidase [Lachnospiraceae bacterium]
MAEKEIYSTFTLGDMAAVFFKEDERVGYTLLPADMCNRIDTEGWWSVEPAVQFKLVGDTYPDGFIHGHSMKNSQSVWEAEFLGQRVEQTEGAAGACSEKNKITRILTTCIRRGLEATSVLEYREGDKYITAYSVFENKGQQDVTLEMASSFNICAFPCVGGALRQQDLTLHRLRSKWSMEGRLESRDFLDLELEPAWLRIGAASERFGEVGSMPVRRFFPWMIVSDSMQSIPNETHVRNSAVSAKVGGSIKHGDADRDHPCLRMSDPPQGYSIGTQLAHNASWQMEVYNKDEKNSISGGIADREFGHWMKTLKAGETFTTPKAILTVAHDDIDGISYRLTSAQMENLEHVPESEKELPVIFNEYCTSWGNPTEEKMETIAQTLKGHGIKYCVIDAGWHVKDGNDWSDIGDWITNKTRFPGGLKKTADKIRECGMIPGLWYEMEVVGKDSEVFRLEDFLLKRDGLPIQTMFRRFLDMRKPQVREFLDVRLIENLKNNGFGYLKVDYNDNLGIGCEGAESLGEGLRLNMEASREYFRRIRREIPEIVIENCSSGGHRLEPSMQGVTSMASFSDAHEWNAIPVIAANVSRAILPAQSQIWAVLRKNDDDKRLYWSLSNTFLGRMCLSGDICDLNDVQWGIVDEAIAFYKKCAPVIKNGRNYRFGPEQRSFNDLRGWQAVSRVSADGTRAVVVVNIFAGYHTGEQNKSFDLEIPGIFPRAKKRGKINITGVFARKSVRICLQKDTLLIGGYDDYDGMVLELTVE